MSSGGARELAAVALPGREGVWDVRLENGRVASVERSAAPPSGRLVLPAFHEPHTHGDRAFAPIPRVPRDLLDAIEMTEAMRATFSPEEVEERALELFRRAAAHGAVRMRTHVDHSPMDGGKRDRRAVRAAARRMGGELEVEIVAFATRELDPVERRNRDALAAALEDGADVLGAFVALNPDPAASLDALLDLARDTGAPVDVHLDEHCDPDASWLEHLADATRARGLEGRVTAGHCCALAMLPRVRARRVVEKVSDAGITIVVLPALNLYLQGRGNGTPRVRGLTLVHELVADGAPVRFGSDNVRDAFYPYGDADPLEAAWLAGVAAQLDDPSALLAGVCGGRRGVEPGDPAELVVVPADSLQDALARRPGPRQVVRG
ncbi:MAG: amidohydrolase family protein [Thermoleophilaceae bacterium]|nr:amidohydrolase family protein [Thermoleophilaceae bacterium]